MTENEVMNIVESKILEILCDLDPGQIIKTSSLKDLGANSVDRADVLINSMEEVGIKIALMEFAQAKNIGDIVQILHSHTVSSNT